MAEMAEMAPFGFGEVFGEVPVFILMFVSLLFVFVLQGRIVVTAGLW